MECFSAENSSNYLLKKLNISAWILPISLGSDDGIKVFLNGKGICQQCIGAFRSGKIGS